MEKLADVGERYLVGSVGTVEEGEFVAGDPVGSRRQVEEQGGGAVQPQFLELPSYFQPRWSE